MIPLEGKAMVDDDPILSTKGPEDVKKQLY